MEIVEVKQKWPKDYLRIEFALGDICNFQCWYCWPSATAAEYKWPNLDLVKKNLSHLLDYYIANTDKRKFEIYVLGGEVTHWKQFIEFMQFFKERYDVIFTITTNGSKSIEWWKEAVKYLDYVYVSHHQRFSKKEHNRELLDFLYEQNVIAVAGVLMDPTCWDDCIETIEYFKKSKRRWSIRYAEVIHETVAYTDAQKKVMSTVRARMANLFYFFRNNPTPRMGPKIIYDTGKSKSIPDNYLILNRLNNFKGWDCSLGEHFLSIRINGSIQGTCGSLLYTEQQSYNLYDSDFVTKFNPTITSTMCNLDGCWCGFDVNMPKKKVIPIHAS